MPAGHAVDLAGEPHGQRRHVELIRQIGKGSELQQALPLDPHLLPQRTGAGLQLVGRKGVVARGHRRVGGEHAAGTHLPHCLVQWSPRRYQLPQPLDQHEAGMSLVRVPDSGIDPHGAEYSHTADAEDPLLAQPELGPAGIQFVHQAAVVRVVRLQVGVEQVDRHAPDLHLPGADVHRSSRGLHRGEPGLSVRSRHRHQRRGTHVVLFVAVFLPTVQCEALIEISLAIEQADSHQRHPQVARRLAVVSRQYSQASRVDRHRVMEPELGAEVRYRSPVQIRITACEPGLVMVALMLHPLHHIIIPAEEVAITGAGGDAGRINPAQQLERVVPGPMPQCLVDRLEKGPRLAAPAPPEVHRDGGETFDAGRQVGNAGLLG